MAEASQESALASAPATLTDSRQTSSDIRGSGLSIDGNKDSAIIKPENNASTVSDPNIVDWDGPDDKENPRNWAKSKKLLNIGLVSLSVLYTYVLPHNQVVLPI